jgi:hypothetical protein
MAEMYFPKSEHTILAPTSVAASQQSAASQNKKMPALCRDAATPDLTIAWSLGAWRLLEAASRGTQFGGMVLLLAPFVAFPSESGLGGKCSATQVKFLRRWLRRDPLAAIADFHQRAGLAGGSAGLPPACDEQMPKAGHRPALRPPTELPYAMPDLLEGLDRLAEDAPPALRKFAAGGMPRNWQALIGDSDSLLDGDAVCNTLPGCTLVRGVGHSIADLLRASQG